MRLYAFLAGLSAASGQSFRFNCHVLNLLAEMQDPDRIRQEPN